MTNYQIRDTVWSVFTSFGFSEAENPEEERTFSIDRKEAVLITGAEKRETAEACAAVFEAAFTCGMEEFAAEIKNEAVYYSLVSFGFENIIEYKRDIKSDFSVYHEDTLFARGICHKDKTVVKINIEALFDICKNGEQKKEVSESLVFAEQGADGIAYDVCYNLRVNGCIVEMYCKDYKIENAEKYAEKNGHSVIIRCFGDESIEIKDMQNNEIIKTDVNDFLGYGEEECDCEDGHCDCGHHH